MQKRIIYISLLVPAIIWGIMTTSCDRDDISSSPPQLVMEAMIDSDGFPIVFLTASVTPDVEGSIRDKVITSAKVTISDGIREVVMTASAKRDYLPPFRYYTFEMRGEPGRTYTVTATYSGQTITARAEMPRPTAIDSVVVRPTDVDSLRSATLYFTAPQDTPAYYYLTMSNPRQYGGQRLPCMLGSIRTVTPGETISLPVLKPRLRMDSTKYISHLLVGETVDVELNRVTRDVYEFWRAFDNMVDFSASPFITTDESLPGNVEGGLG
ncbi:MAG: DUF4249 domain-containing protein, partial [Muribaculaceae bacterium]|nr:DUF4249 domain-containing protein [Muribaculaceae bacterium]